MYELIIPCRQLVFFAASQSVSRFDSIPSLIIACVALGIFVAIACYISLKLRDGQKPEEEANPSELMSQFGELYRKGELTKEEYGAIRLRLAAKLAAMPPREPREKGRKGRSGRGRETQQEREAELERLLRGRW